jgi:hypothetical protein
MFAHLKLHGISCRDNRLFSVTFQKQGLRQFHLAKIKFIALDAGPNAATPKRHAFLRCGSLATLFPSAPWSLGRTVSASAQIKLAQPLSISRDMPSIQTDYFIARSTSHQICGSFESRMYLFVDHQLSFATGLSAAAHQFHHPLRNYTIGFDR